MIFFFNSLPAIACFAIAFACLASVLALLGTGRMFFSSFSRFEFFFFSIIHLPTFCYFFIVDCCCENGVEHLVENHVFYYTLYGIYVRRTCGHLFFYTRDYLLALGSSVYCLPPSQHPLQAEEQETRNLSQDWASLQGTEVKACHPVYYHGKHELSQLNSMSNVVYLYSTNS